MEQSDLTYFEKEIDPVALESLKQLEFFTILDHIRKYAYSQPGKELIAGALPSDDLVYLRSEHDLTDEMSRLLIKETDLPMDGLTDTRSPLQKSLIQNAACTPAELLAIRDFIRAGRVIRSFIINREQDYQLLRQKVDSIHENRLLEKHISEAINDNGDIRDTASRELQRIRRSIFEKSNNLRSRLQKILKKVSEEDMNREDFYSMREGRFVIPIKSEHKRHISGIIHGVSQTGATVFLEPSEIIEMNNELSLLANEELREIQRILTNLTSEIGDEARLFLANLEILAHLDSVRAKARFAIEHNCIKPDINDENYVYMKDVRHPLLVINKGAKKVQPLTAEFTTDKRGHLISGPNAGGKTVALKSIGLNLALALSGIFPFGMCVTNILKIYSSIGDQQSIENDLSTFSSQIIRIKEILSVSDAKSLVLIDEICSGTDPQEGSALAAGILDTFINMNLFFVVTTHQSSLKTYALNRVEISNASLEFDDKNMKPTYKFLSGVPGNSYAFVLAKNLGLSKLVLERSSKYLGSKQSELESSIAILQKYRSDIEEKQRLINEKLVEMTKVKDKYERKLSDIKEKRQIYIDRAKEQAEAILTKANSLVESTIREIREDKKSISEIKKDYEHTKSDLTKKIRSVPQSSNSTNDILEFRKGDYVTAQESDNVGIVVDSDLINRIALVEFNGLKFRLPFDQLHPSKPIERKKSAASEFIRFDVKSSVDLRGMRVDEALREVDEYISGALLGNIKTFTIIHGKGTGALKQAMQDYLKNHYYVESYRLGELVEGGSGVTIVELRYD